MKTNFNFEKEYVMINGIEQFMVHFSADNVDKDVVLFLHGGPGTSEATSGHYVFKYHFDAFTMVYYDQRGAGKTLKRNPGEEPDVEILLKDLHEIVEYLKKKYNKEKIVLLGHSWGTILATLYISEHKENISCFISSGQIINKKLHEKARCEYLCGLLEQNNKSKEVKFMNELNKLTNGQYDYDSMDKKQQRHLRMLEIKNHMLSGASLKMLKIMKSSPVYEKDDLKLMMNAKKYNNKLYDYVDGFDLYENMVQWPVKTLFISGNQDFQAPYSLVKDYVNKIKQENVEYFEIDNCGHFALYDESEQFFSKMKESIASV